LPTIAKLACPGPTGRVPSRLGRRKTLTLFLLWRGPLVPTAPLNSSIGAGWITSASLLKRHRIGWTAALHTENRDRLMDFWRHLLDSGEAGEVEARLRRCDGDYRWFLFLVEPVRDNHGGILKWYGANTDIEDRRSHWSWCSRPALNPKEGRNTTTAARAESLLAAEKRRESPSGNIICEWHSQVFSEQTRWDCRVDRDQFDL
jgi:hypothetical protein